MQKLLDKIHFWKTHYEALYVRQRVINHYLKTHKIKKLHVGCGEFLLPSWLNSDLYGNEKVVPIDLTKKLPILNSSIDYIFSEQVIEHFTYFQGEKILYEMFRVLKSQGKIRIATPNLKFVVELYSKNKTPWQKTYIKAAINLSSQENSVANEAFIINDFFHAWGHKFIYDFKTLEYTLKKIGFTNITRCTAEKSTDQNLQKLERHGKIMGKELYNLEALVIEAQKP